MWAKMRNSPCQPPDATVAATKPPLAKPCVDIQQQHPKRLRRLSLSSQRSFIYSLFPYNLSAPLEGLFILKVNEGTSNACTSQL